jgi:hypothetical protein
MARRETGPKESGLTDDQAKHLAGVLARFLKRYDGNQTTMARAWGISQPQLSQLLGARKKGAGVSVLCRIRKHAQMSLDDLLGLPALEKTTEEARIRAIVVQALDELGREPTSENGLTLPVQKERR